MMIMMMTSAFIGWFLMLLCTTAAVADQAQQQPQPSDSLIKLIIKSYVEEMLDDPLVSSPELKQRLATISDYIARHPALHQRYLWVGPEPPPAGYNPDYHHPHHSTHHHLHPHQQDSILIFDRNNDSMVTTLKKKAKKSDSEHREPLPSEEICETKEKWEQIDMTHDMFDNKVKVIQEKDMQQFVFSYRCATNKGKCRGISPLFESECTERYGWMYMYYKPEDKPPQWGFVNAPHHCACKLKPKLFHNGGGSEQPQTTYEV